MSMNPDRNYFKEFKGDCDVFVETGTYMGGGITLAVLAGFTEIHSIDLKDQIPPDYKHGLKAIYRHIGDSAEKLNELLPELQEKKIMFWLDAHSQMTEGEQDSFPLMKELEAIRKSGVKNAVILIDDFLYMSHPDITGFTKSQIVKALKDINPSYEISFLPNPVKNNILLARPIKEEPKAYKIGEDAPEVFTPKVKITDLSDKPKTNYTINTKK